MKIGDILDKDCIVTDLKSSDKEEVLREMVSVLAKKKDIGNPEDILSALIEREKLGSTGIGQGIAIPHGKTDKTDKIVACLGVSKTGVAFDSLDGEPVYILFLLLAPVDSAGPHLKALARISRILRDAYFCELIRKAESADKIYDLIIREDEKKS